MVLTHRLLIVALALSVLVIVLPSSATVWAALGMLAVLVITDMTLAGSPRRLQVHRVPTDPVRLGQRTTAETELIFHGTRTLRGSVKDGWQPSAGARDPLSEVQLSPGGRRRITTTLNPARRGELVSSTLAVRSLGPLGLAGRQVVHTRRHVQRVLPPFRSRKHLPSKLQQLRELDGQTAVQLRGAGTEFDSLRDYVRGDDVRSIDWRATARRRSAAGQQLVVRTWRPERDRRVILCLDSSRTSAARIDDETRLDSGMEASLLLGALAAGVGDRVDFIGFDRQIVSRAASSSSGDFLHQLVDVMATMKPELIEADFSRLPAHVESISSQRSLVVILTALESGSLEEGLLPVLPALTAKHLVLLAGVRDPELDRRSLTRETTGDVYRAAAAERAIIEREAKKAQLVSLGVEVVDAMPHELPPQLADTYIRLKATGRL